MHRKVLIALAVLLAMAGGVSAQTIADKLDWSFKIGEADSRANSKWPANVSTSDPALGWSGKMVVSISASAYEADGTFIEHPPKYKIRWTVGKWLKDGKPNPSHGRRGNVETTSNWAKPFISIPAGEVLRVRAIVTMSDGSKARCSLRLDPSSRNNVIFYWWVMVNDDNTAWVNLDRSVDQAVKEGRRPRLASFAEWPSIPLPVDDPPHGYQIFSFSGRCD